METFLVGGAVRDSFLNREVKDRDFVVTGATEQEMLDQGFTRVGADFPVFLHPATKDEHALARRERKTGNGHKGFEVDFDPTVTLEEDLERRDLTINAIAQNMVTGELVDPFNGVLDVANKVFNPVNPQTFVEDPVRALRVIRFMARFGSEWSMSQVMEDTLFELIKSGEFKHLVKERVLLEMTKALDEPNWWLFFTTEAHGRPVFNEVIRQMMGKTDRDWQLGWMSNLDVTRTDREEDAFGRACVTVRGFEEILNFLKASNDMKSLSEAHRVLNSWVEVPFGNGFEWTTGFVEKAHLFDDQHPVFKHLTNMQDNSEFLVVVLVGREKAMRFKFNDVRLDDESAKITAERLNDLRVSIVLREVERHFFDD